MRWGWLVLMVAGLGSTASAGPCAMRGGLEGKPLGHSGGFVLGTVATFDELGAGGPPAPNHGGWTLQVDGATQHATFVMVAPGLGVVERPAGATAVVVTNGSFKMPIEGDGIKTLPAPKVSRVASSSTSRPAGSQRMTFTTVTAKVKSIPDDAVALVLFGIEKGTRVPRSWIAVEAGDGGELTLYETAGRCSVSTPGEPSNAGDNVQLAWLDRSGKLSKLTGTLTVAKSK